MRSPCFSFRHVLVVALLLAIAPSASAKPAHSAVAAQPIGADRVDQAVAEAAARFALPRLWIRAFIRAESFGDAHAVSAKGALGLMQVMPNTYSALRAELRLGSDPFDVHDNVLAGAAYMRAMFDRYGPVGMVGAYNAGPARWESFLAGVQPLPAETLAYIARLAPNLGLDLPGEPSIGHGLAIRSPLEAPLFVRPPSRSTASDPTSQAQRVLASIDANPTLVQPSRGAFGAPDRPIKSPEPAGLRLGSPSSITASEPSKGLFVPSTPRETQP
jgi:hypothetical protein